MPQWNLGVQDLVNKWVNVNKTHVVFPLEGKRGESQQNVLNDEREVRRIKPSSALRTRQYTTGDEASESDMSRGVVTQSYPARSSSAVKHDPRHGGDWNSTALKTSTTATTAMSSKPRGLTVTNGTHHTSVVIKRGNKLRRSNSYSDLLKEKVIHEDTVGRRQRPSRPGILIAKKTPPRHPPNGVSHRGAVNRKRDEGRPEKSVSLSQHIPDAEGLSTASLANSSLELAPSRRKNRKKKNSTYHSTKNINELREPLHLQHSAISNFPSRDEYMKNLHERFSNERAVICSEIKCQHCHDVEKKMNLMLSDMEFLRSIALRYEQGIHNCDASVCTDATQGIRDAAYRIDEVTARHKRQIEQMTKERARWQNDMHLKLSKFALLCKELNEESAIRKQDAESAKSELNAVRADRDALASEIEILRARIDLHDRDKLENDRLRQILSEKDEERLGRSEMEIQKRDILIEELTKRLGTSMKTLQMERQIQRERRIIFPVSKSNEDLKDYRISVKELKEQLARAEDAARMAQIQLEEERNEASMREETLQYKCRLLTDEVRAMEKSFVDKSIQYKPD